MSPIFFDALIALAGSGSRLDFFASWTISRSRLILAADGGTDLLMDLGFTPDFLVGDYDSISEKALQNLSTDTVRVELSRDKDFTDGELATAAAVLLSCDQDLKDPAFSKPDGRALYLAFEKAGDLTGKSYAFLNYTGERVDHQLANIALARLLAVRGATVFLTDGLTLGRIVKGPVTADPVFPADCFDSARAKVPGKRFLFSALPLDDEVDGLCLHGLKWELDGVRLPMGRSLALSNRASGPYPLQVTARLKAGVVLFYTFPEDL
ncbi:MAG TPA: thiamine pyrophosphokinase [Bacillota bacterium]|jgi:thiamine pyrophosphokinase|nr:thiamine pyrophosphokinase [Fastidiosipila sp.]HPX93819.1 thiamine pyrophosphokinase [Bacillota bacterium]HQB81644.1 thiamine pyrophosphokinase [Bacillota bacterium]